MQIPDEDREGVRYPFRANGGRLCRRDDRQHLQRLLAPGTRARAGASEEGGNDRTSSPMAPAPVVTLSSPRCPNGKALPTDERELTYLTYAGVSGAFRRSRSIIHGTRYFPRRPRSHPIGEWWAKVSGSHGRGDGGGAPIIGHERLDIDLVIAANMPAETTNDQAHLGAVASLALPTTRPLSGWNPPAARGRWRSTRRVRSSKASARKRSCDWRGK